MNKNIIFILIVIISSLYSQGMIKNKSHITSYTMRIKKNIRTTVTLTVPVSSLNDILFDNILSESQEIMFIHQPYYFDMRDSISDKISIPFPILNSGLYEIHYVSTDTIYKEKYVYLE